MDRHKAPTQLPDRPLSLHFGGGDARDDLFALVFAEIGDLLHDTSAA